MNLWNQLCLSVLTGAILLSSAAVYAQDSPAAPATAAPQASAGAMMQMNDTDKKFAKMAGYGNASEVAAGKLALTKSQNNEVRMVAETLVREHSEALNALIPIGKAANHPVPTEPDPTHKKMAAKLSKMSEASFNKEFIKGQIKDHHATIALFGKEIASGENADLKAFAQKYLPGIKEHTKMIYQAATALGVPNPGSDGSGPPAKM